ncbi:MAG TPA: hypothetical protein PK432_00295 [Candidatus Dojkabacteria bacterium]|nr:hypothetical protein [Candidatus Dojkabacteria bacterium]
MDGISKMLIYSAEWNGQPSFRLIPIMDNCPFMEVMYNPEDCILAVISKTKTNIPSVKTKEGEDGEVFYEYYIESKQDILDFIKTVAVNYPHPIIEEVL